MTKTNKKKAKEKVFFFFDKKEIYGLINISKNKNLFFWISLDRSDQQTGRFRSTAGGCLEMDRYIDMQTRRMDISISLLLARPWWISGGTSCFFSSRAESTFIPLDLCLPPSMYIPLSFFFAIYWSIVGQLQQWSHFHGESSCFINALFFVDLFPGMEAVNSLLYLHKLFVEGEKISRRLQNKEVAGKEWYRRSPHKACVHYTSSGLWNYSSHLLAWPSWSFRYVAYHGLYFITRAGPIAFRPVIELGIAYVIDSHSLGYIHIYCIYCPFLARIQLTYLYNTQDFGHRNNTHAQEYCSLSQIIIPLTSHQVRSHVSELFLKGHAESVRSPSGSCSLLFQMGAIIYFS